jgi:outer membrane protein assembly factor BamB
MREPTPESPETLQDLNPSWTFQSPYGQPDRGLLMAGDRLIGLYDKRVIYALDIYTGQEIKTVKADVADATVPFHTCQDDQPTLPAIAAGAVYFIENGQLKALQLADGQPRPGWQDPQVEGIKALAGFDDAILAVQSSWGKTQINAYKTADGTPAWRNAPFAISDYSSGAIALGLDAIFFVAQNRLYAVNTDFGDKRFPQDSASPTLPYNLDQTQPPLVAKNVVVCCGDTVCGFDIKTGVCRWTIAASGAATWSAALSADQRWIVAVSSAGRVCVVDPDAGKDPATGYVSLLCETTVPEGGVPTIAGQTIYFVTPDRARMRALTIDLRQKHLGEAGLYSLGPNVSPVGPVIGNGTLFVPTSDGNLSAKPFASVQAACFNGQTYVDVQPDASQFKFGTGDFSVEAWVRSTQGGEILSGYPADSDANSHGFRFNLTAQGELRFAAINADRSNQDLAKSLPSLAADGYWHHVAVMRKAGAISMFIDGVSSPVATLHYRNNQALYRNGAPVNADLTPILGQLAPAAPPPPCNISGQHGLSIGAWIGGAQSAPEAPFVGLMREVRVWDIAIEVSKLQSRMTKILPPNVAHLVGNWHLDDNETKNVKVVNDVDGHEYPAAFVGGLSVPTDLVLDDSCFPYLLDQVELQWPYSGHWTARGEHDVQTPAVLSDDGVVCFGTNNALYGVNKSDGSRLWSVPIDGRCSYPVAFGGAFHVMTKQFGLIEIDSRSGQFAEVDGFQRLGPDSTASRLSAPARDGRFLAAAAPDGRIWIKDLAGNAVPAQMHVAPNPGDLVIENGKLYCVAGLDGARTLYVVDPAHGDDGARPVSTVDCDIFAAHGSWVFFIQKDRLVATDLSKPDSKASIATSVKGSEVTGLVADADAGLLVVSTNQGRLLGLTFSTLGLRWQTAIPDGDAAGPQAARGFLNAPSVAGRDIYCTSRSGAVAAVDGRTGQLRGLFLEKTAVITPALVESGTVYFGCDAAAPTAHLDGALHSVVFGGTYALRLGLDPLDHADSKNGYAVVEQADQKQAIELRNVQQCCAEAWVNTAAGGEILSIHPSSTSRLGLRLWLERAPAGSPASTGTVHFVLYDMPPGQTTWQGLHAQALSSTLCDAKWHHVAVSCEGPTNIRIYVDGVAHDVSYVEAPSAPSAAIPGLRAYIGADATQQDSVPANFFKGLVGEVRLWDTYLVASEISERMHDKLRGDEPDLLAYWNFDTVGVHDGSRNQRNGSLAPEGGGATFWLTDLTFEHPSYPYVTSQAALVQTGEAGLPADDPRSRTVYELAVTVHKADGSPLAGQNVELWYVKHADMGDPASVEILKGMHATTLTGIAPAQPESSSQDSFKDLTDTSGCVKIQVATNDLDHGPSFDLRADFMPANERYHVNVLLDNQAMAKPTPPYLVAQSKLIQDYHWSTGGAINSDRSRETYRTVIAVLNPDHTPRSNERVEIWATGHVDIEVNGSVYPINPDNSHACYTDEQGELTVVLSATDLQAPHLSIWAGFMDRQARYAVDPSQDAHKTLAGVSGDEMADNQRMTNWKPDHEGGPQRGALLGDDYKPHKDKIATAINHVMSATQDAPAAPTPPAPTATGNGTAGGMPLGLPEGDAVRAPFADMQQRLPMPRADLVRSLKTLRHIGRRAPVTPEAMLASLQRVAPGSVGFVFGCDGSADSFKFSHLMPEDVAAAMGTPTAIRGEQPLGGFFGDLWHAVTHFVESVYDRAKRIAVSIGNAIVVAIHTVDSVIHTVVNSIVEAVKIVANFLKQLALEIWQIIQFLLMLFDWGAIIKAHDIIKATLFSCADLAVSTLSDADKISRQVLDLLADTLGLSLSGQAGAASQQSAADIQQAGGPDNHPASAQSNSVAGKMIRSKVQEQRDGLSVGGAELAAFPSPAGVDDLGSLGEVIRELLDLLPDLVTMNMSDLGSKLLALMKKLAEEILSGAINIALQAAKVLAACFKGMLEVLNASISIPFLSALYRWITGNDLSILDLLCLMLAVPVHIAYLVVTGHLFSNGASDLADSLAPARPLGGEGDSASGELLPYGSGDNVTREVVFVVFRSLFIVFGTGTDATFTVRLGVTEHPYRCLLKMAQGICGLVSSSLLFACSMPHFINMLRKKLGNKFERGSFIGISYEVRNIVAYSFSLAGDALTLGGGIKGWWAGQTLPVTVAPINLPTLGPKTAWGPNPSPTAPPALPAPVSIRNVEPGTVDRCEFSVGLAISAGKVGLLVMQFVELGKGPEYGDSDRDVAMSSRLLFARDTLNALATLPGFMFTQTGARWRGYSPTLYWGMTALRCASMTSALVCHSVGEFSYVKP